MACAVPAGAQTPKESFLSQASAHEEGAAKVLRDSLIGDDPAELWMWVSPTFDVDRVIILRRPVAGAARQGPPKWLLEEGKATVPTWHWKDQKQSSGTSTAKQGPDHMTVERRFFDLDESAALMFRGAWRNAIPKIRAKAHPPVGQGRDIEITADGSSYRFYVAPGEEAQISNPRMEEPAALVSVGENLFKLVESEDEVSQAKILKQALAEAAPLAADAGSKGSEAHAP